MNLKRTPKNYQGTKSPAKKVGELLSEYLTLIEPKKKGKKEEVFKAWYDMIGNRFKEHTQPLSFVDGELEVLVKNQTLYALLVSHEKRRYLDLLQKKFSSRVVKKLRFRVG